MVHLDVNDAISVPPVGPMMSPAFFPRFFPFYTISESAALHWKLFKRTLPSPFLNFLVSLFFSPSALWGFTKLSHKAARLCFHIPTDRHIFPSAHLRLFRQIVG